MTTPTPSPTSIITVVKNPFAYVTLKGSINNDSEAESSTTIPIDYVDEIKLGLSRIEDLLRRHAAQDMKKKAEESIQVMQKQMETCLASLQNNKLEDLKTSVELMHQRLELFYEQCRQAMQHSGSAKRTLESLLHPVEEKIEEEEPPMPEKPEKPRRNELRNTRGRFASPRNTLAEKRELAAWPPRKRRRRSLHYRQNTNLTTKLDYCDRCHRNKVLYRTNEISDKGKILFLCETCSMNPTNENGDLDKHMSRWSAKEENNLLLLVLEHADSFLCQQPTTTIAGISKKISSVLGRSPAAIRKRMKSMKILLHSPGNPVLIHELSKRGLLKYVDDLTAQLKPSTTASSRQGEVEYDSDLTEDEEDDDGDI